MLIHQYIRKLQRGHEHVYSDRLLCPGTLTFDQGYCHCTSS